MSICVIRDDVSNPTIDTSGVTVEVKYVQKARLPPARIPEELAKGVYNNSDESRVRKSRSGKHREVDCIMHPLPLGRMVSVPIKDNNKTDESESEFQPDENEDPNAEYEDVQEGSAIYRRKVVSFTETEDKSAIQTPAHQQEDEIDSLKGLLKEGGSRIERKLQEITPASLPECTKEISQVRRILSAVVARVYDFVKSLFEVLRMLCCCLTPIASRFSCLPRSEEKQRQNLTKANAR